MDAWNVIDLNTRFQISAAAIFIVIVIDYVRGKKSTLAASKWFSIMLIFTGIYLISDTATIFTINLAIDSAINRAVHQFYLISLVTIVFSLSIYVEMLGYRFRNMSKLKIAFWLAPYAASVIMCLVSDFSYTVTSTVSYLAYGPVVFMVYFTLGFYILWIVCRSFNYKNIIPKKKCHSLQISAIIWTIFACVQMFTQSYLASSLGISIEILILYLSFENAGETTDQKTGFFNAKVLEAVLTEHFRFKPKFTVINVTFPDSSAISAAMSKTAVYELYKQCCGYISLLFDSPCYRYDDDTYTFITTDSKSLEQKLNILEGRFMESWTIAHIHAKVNIAVDVIRCPDYVSNIEEFNDVTRYMDVSRGKTGKKIQIADSEMIKAKQRHDMVKNVVNNAVSNDGFEVWYQPIYSTAKKRFVSAEALIRLKDKETVGFISPEEFIPILEGNGLILETGLSVFRKVCEFAKKASLKELGVEYVEVNLSGVQAVDTALPGQLKAIAEKYGINPGFFNLEITETAAVSSGELLRANMDALIRNGFSFSMDDFGTGYSNLSQIAEMPYDLIKLDKSLIWPCFGENPSTNALCILENVIVMLLSQNIRIVAEGVETQEMVDALTNYRINYLQGYYFSRPLCEADYIKFLKEHHNIQI
ncbi:MAG: EAL domain-containing protein [Oscillospiraceae bacterium]|nr:EAL domain-containing protein [Oscillospiraceae bacterium]